MADGEVRAAYADRAGEYTSLMGAIEAMAEPDREFISRWADSVSGRILDSGCGPGHWTDFLSRRRARGRETHDDDVEGADLTPTFVEGARAHFPGVRYRVASHDALGLPDGSLGGILAWYSLIHLEPERVPAALAEFARCLGPGGRLLIGFFEGERLEAFPHAVVTAYFWPVAEMSRLLEEAGFSVGEAQARQDPGTRPHAAVSARLPG